MVSFHYSYSSTSGIRLCLVHPSAARTWTLAMSRRLRRIGGACFSVKFQDILDTLLRDILDTLSIKAGAWGGGGGGGPGPPPLFFLVFWFLWARIRLGFFRGRPTGRLRRIARIAASRLSTARVGTDHQGAWH